MLPGRCRPMSGRFGILPALLLVSAVLLPQNSSGDNGFRLASQLLPPPMSPGSVKRESALGAGNQFFSRAAGQAQRNAGPSGGTLPPGRPHEDGGRSAAQYGRDKRLRPSVPVSSEKRLRSSVPSSSAAHRSEDASSSLTDSGGGAAGWGGTPGGRSDTMQTPQLNPSDAVAANKETPTQQGREVMSLISDLREVRRRICARKPAQPAAGVDGAGGTTSPSAPTGSPTSGAQSSAPQGAAAPTPSGAAGSSQWQSSLDSFRTGLSSPPVADAAVGNATSAAYGQGLVQDDCVVCGEVLVEQMLGRVSCQHVFCYECIFRWGSTCENTYTPRL
jgi:hypothetical protein